MPYTTINYLQRNGGTVAMGVVYVNYMATTNDEIMERKKITKKQLGMKEILHFGKVYLVL